MSKGCLAGGLPVVRPRPLPCDEGPQELHLMTDLHLGSAACDVRLIREELTAAKRRRARVLLGGDVIDGILPGDKRYRPATIVPTLRGRNDLLNAEVEYAAGVLSPYADVIDMIGVGNHETAVERRNSYDPIRDLICLLQEYRSADLPPIAYGSYTAYVNYDLVAAGRRKARYVCWYHHGHARIAKPEAALTQLRRQTASFAADLYWSGHSHCRVNCCEKMLHCPRSGDSPVSRDVRCVITGAYTVTYAEESQESILLEGRRGTYGSDEAMQPHGLGGARVVLEFDEPGFPTRVRVEQ